MAPGKLRVVGWLVALLVVCGADRSARSELAADCKACAAERKICRQAHSQQACDSEYAICVKHCPRK
jgi:hypothetical protein